MLKMILSHMVLTETFLTLRKKLLLTFSQFGWFSLLRLSCVAFFARLSGFNSEGNEEKNAKHILYTAKQQQ